MEQKETKEDTESGVFDRLKKLTFNLGHKVKLYMEYNIVYQHLNMCGNIVSFKCLSYFSIESSLLEEAGPTLFSGPIHI